MDTEIVKETDGKKFNQYDQQVIPCIICNNPTIMLGTELCDRCFELDARIRDDLDIAKKLVNFYDHK